MFSAGKPRDKKSAGWPHARKCRVVSRFCGRGHECNMDSTFAPQFLDHISGSGIESVGGAKRSGKFKLLLGDVDRGHIGTQSPPELHREVPQATYPENRKALSGNDCSTFQSAIDREPPAQKSGAASSAERPSGIFRA